MTRRLVPVVSILCLGFLAGLGPKAFDLHARALRDSPAARADGTPLLPQELPSSVYATVITLDHPNPQAGAYFGFGLTGVGDTNGDGIRDLVVAAYDQDVGVFARQGQAYVISGADGSLLVTLDDPAPQASAFFGERMAGVGDVNGDGMADVLVGAEWQNVGGYSHTGAAFLFSGADGSLLRTLNNPSPQDNAYFGFPVARAADFNGDGLSELLVGAPGQDVGGIHYQGQAFLFDGSTGSLLLTLDAPHSNAAGLNGPFFGESLAQVGDINTDGVPDILVGARFLDVGATNWQGEAYVMSGADGSLLLTVHSPEPAQREFGWPVGVIDDLNGDGVTDLLVGAYRHGAAGRGYAFSGADGSLLLTLDNPSGQLSGYFSFYQLVDTGDVNADGVPDVLIGAEGVDVGGNAYQGQAYLFSGADGSLLRTFDHPSPQAGGAFGITAASAGDIDADGVSDLLIAATCQDVGGNACQGQAYVFLSGATPETLLENLIDSVTDLGLQPGFSALLNAALNALTDLNPNNDAAALNALTVFINSVNGQRGATLTNEQADELVAAAQYLIGLAGG